MAVLVAASASSSAVGSCAAPRPVRWCVVTNAPLAYSAQRSLLMASASASMGRRSVVSSGSAVMLGSCKFGVRWNRISPDHESTYDSPGRPPACRRNAAGARG